MSEKIQGRGRPKGTKKLPEGVRFTLMLDKSIYEYLEMTANRETQGNISHLVRRILVEEVERRRPPLKPKTV